MRAAAALLVGALALPVLATGAAAADGDVQFSAQIDGRSVERIDRNEPARLVPAQALDIDVSVTNTGSEPVQVRSVRLQARVVGLTFLTYSTRVDLELAPGETGRRHFALDISDLGEQATGLLPAQLQLLGPDRQVLSVQAFPVDVRAACARCTAPSR